MKKKLSFLVMGVFIMGMFFTTVPLAALEDPNPPPEKFGGGAALNECRSRATDTYYSERDHCYTWISSVFWNSRVACLEVAVSNYRDNLMLCEVNPNWGG